MCYNGDMDAEIKIRHVESADREFWFSLDKHISEAEFAKKVRDGQGYILLSNNRPVGILRYNLFWDNTPFCTLLFVADGYRRLGYGAALMREWENEMRALGYEWVLLSTQSDEPAQHFYRALGYSDCGELLAPDQPSELFMLKRLNGNA